MNVRRARPGEYLAFTRLADAPREFRRELARLVDLGYTAPRLWFVAEEEGRVAAAAIYWALPSLPEEMMLLDLMLDFDAPGADARALELLRGSTAELRAAGARRLETRLFSDSTSHAARKLALYERFGLPLLQVKESYAAEAPLCFARPAPRLTLEPLAVCGLSAFLDAIAAVNARTLDRYDLWSARDGGNVRHAEEMFAALSDIDRDETLWHLARDGEGLAGCLVPQRLDGETGMVNYFGVVPAKRGRGYGFELFAAAAGLLERAGVRRIVCDLDVENRPMIRILERAGLAPSFRVHVLKGELEGLPSVTGDGRDIMIPG